MPRAWSIAKLRGAEKSSCHANSNTRAPKSAATLALSSFDPVSTTTTSSTKPRIDSRHRASDAASSRTISVAEISVNSIDAGNRLRSQFDEHRSSPAP